MDSIDKKGIEFLNRLYKDMYNSETVMHGIDKRFIGNKVDNISHYIDRMQKLHERVGTSDRESDLRMLKHFYYQRYIIKEEYNANLGLVQDANYPSQALLLPKDEFIYEIDLNTRTIKAPFYLQEM